MLTFAPKRSLAAAAIALALASGGTAAWAGGTETHTDHVHGADAFGIDELDLLTAPPGVTVPEGCWLGTTNGIISTYGNGVLHWTSNRTGFWMTSTYTGDAAVYPLLFVDGHPVFDPDTQSDEVDTSAAPLATGHLTQWFGNEDNNKNGVEHATVTFKGVDAAGDPVQLQGHFQFAMNANGEPTATVGSITC